MGGLTARAAEDAVSVATAAFLGAPFPVVVGTRRAGGAVKLTTAWFEYADGCFWLNSWRGAHWLAHIERDGAATLLVVDPRDMHRTVHVEARLLSVTTDGAVAHLDRLSYRYLGRAYRSATPRQRVVIRLAPTGVRSTVG